jgi:hypothetical protein
MSKYYAVMKNGETVITTILNEGDHSYDEAVKCMNKWAAYYTDDKITLGTLKQRSQAEQKSFHGLTEARGWR